MTQRPFCLRRASMSVCGLLVASKTAPSSEWRTAEKAFSSSFDACAPGSFAGSTRSCSLAVTEQRAANGLGRRLALEDGRAPRVTDVDADRAAEPRARVERGDVRGPAAERVDHDRGDRARQPAPVAVGELRLEVDDATRRGASADALERS